MESARSNWGQEAQPLQLSSTFYESSTRSSTSPYFENLLPRSNTLSSPQPTLSNQFQTSTPNHLSSNFDAQHSSTTSFTNANELRLPSSLAHNPHTVNPADPSPTSYLHGTTSNPWPSSQTRDLSEQWASGVSNAGRANAKPADQSFSNINQTKRFERSPSNTINNRTYEARTLNNATNNTFTSSTSSDVRMIKSSNKTPGFVSRHCSPRCKLGLLGFTIGFLAVGIAVAVVLVLWLRRQ